LGRFGFFSSVSLSLSFESHHSHSAFFPHQLFNSYSSTPILLLVFVFASYHLKRATSCIHNQSPSHSFPTSSVLSIIVTPIASIPSNPAHHFIACLICLNPHLFGRSLHTPWSSLWVRLHLRFYFDTAVVGTATYHHSSLPNRSLLIDPRIILFVLYSFLSIMDAKAPNLPRILMYLYWLILKKV